MAGGLCKDAGLNPGRGKRFDFTMTRFVHYYVPLPPFRDIEIIIKSPLNKWRGHLCETKSYLSPGAG